MPSLSIRSPSHQKRCVSKHQNILKALTLEDLINASKEEEKGQPFSNPSVKVVQQQLKAIRTKIQGTDESQVSI